jgi:hypothetical protein
MSKKMSKKRSPLTKRGIISFRINEVRVGKSADSRFAPLAFGVMLGATLETG